MCFFGVCVCVCVCLSVCVCSLKDNVQRRLALVHWPCVITSTQGAGGATAPCAMATQVTELCKLIKIPEKHQRPFFSPAKQTVI